MPADPAAAHCVGGQRRGGHRGKTLVAASSTLAAQGEATNGVAGFSDVLLDLQPPVNLLFWAPCFALSSPRDLTKRQGLRLKPPADSSCVSPDQTSRASACNASLPGIHRGPQGQTLPPPPAPPPLLWEVDGSSILCLFMFPVWKSP